MAAVTGHIEGQHDTVELVPLHNEAHRAAVDAGALELPREALVAQALGAPKEEGSEKGGATKLKPLETAHAGLVRMAWFRSALYNEIVKRQIDLVKVKENAPPYGGYAFLLQPGLDGNTVPWNPTAGGRERAVFKLFSTNSKMACPTWDLPAGVYKIGGSCPGADGGQVIASTVKGGLPIVGRPERVLERAICNACYAVGSGYERFEAQAGELTRMLWTSYWLGRDPEVWISTMVAAVKLVVNEARWWGGPRGKSGINPLTVLPFRLHSSGDFFSFQYAAAWVEVINRVRDWQLAEKRTSETRPVAFWAPTRTWATGYAWQAFWAATYGIELPHGSERERESALRHAVKLKHSGSLVIRPSAFHFDDPAPKPGEVGSPYAGSTSIYKQRLAELIEEGEEALHAYATYTCPVYAAGKGSKSCNAAPAPNGKIGCRVCWVDGKQTVNYVAH